MNHNEAKELAMKMVEDMADSIIRVYNRASDEDYAHADGPCVVVFMSKRDNGMYRLEIMRHYKCCVKYVLSRFGSADEGSVLLMDREESVATVVFIESFAIGISVKKKGDTFTFN